MVHPETGDHGPDPVRLGGAARVQFGKGQQGVLLGHQRRPVGHHNRLEESDDLVSRLAGQALSELAQAPAANLHQGLIFGHAF